mgnify:CR=1 FL=1
MFRKLVSSSASKAAKRSLFTPNGKAAFATISTSQQGNYNQKQHQQQKNKQNNFLNRYQKRNITRLRSITECRDMKSPFEISDKKFHWKAAPKNVFLVHKVDSEQSEAAAAQLAKYVSPLLRVITLLLNTFSLYFLSYHFTCL